MKDLIRTSWEKNFYPFIDLNTFKSTSITKDKFHLLMNSQPSICKADPSTKNLELLFKITLTKILRSYNINQKHLEFGDFVSDAYLVFHQRFQKFNPEKSNWFSYCKYISMDLERKYKEESEEKKYFAKVNIDELEKDED